MPWKQCTLGCSESYEQIRDGVELLAAKAGDQADVLLLTRTTADRRSRVLLLSPLALELAGEVLSSRWTECDAPELFEWDLVVGPTEAFARLGFRRPRFQRRDPCPPFVFGGAGPSDESASPSPPA